MSNAHLNLARKWRSKNFDEIIGQSLSVRMLKNSLYLNKFFPVYLFAGQRGCGKTTTARVFARALNCEQLEAFQKDPRNTLLPCLNCQSCTAMESNSHPDFIEMDAASHTGVDNVRQIVEAASLMPLMGKKKIYLIDEAHMLSKAAFNAFLKILEEPPASVLFILATTDDQKVIDTVRSRCFQLFFKAIDSTDLQSHLIQVCQEEKIQYDEKGIELLIRETGGSCRDALNLLEQVRFARDSVSEANVLSVLGYLGDEQVSEIINHIVSMDSQDPSSLLAYLDSINIKQYTPDIVWHRLLIGFKAVVWNLYGVNTQEFTMSPGLEEKVKSLSLHDVVLLFDFICNQELLFVKAVDKHAFLSLFFVRLFAILRDTASVSVAKPKEQVQAPQRASQVSQPQPERVVQQQAPVKQESQQQAPRASNVWDTFLEKISRVDEQLIVSLFSQAQLRKVDKVSNTVEIVFQKKFQLFQDIFEKTDAPWFTCVKEVFGGSTKIVPIFESIEGSNVVTSAAQKQPSSEASPHKVVSSQGDTQRANQNRYSSRPGSSKEKLIDVSDKEAWSVTNALLEQFPGTVTECKEDSDE